MKWQTTLGEVTKFLAETTKTRMEVGTGDVNGGNGIRVDVGWLCGSLIVRPPPANAQIFQLHWQSHILTWYLFKDQFYPKSGFSSFHCHLPICLEALFLFPTEKMDTFVQNLVQLCLARWIKSSMLCIICETTFAASGWWEAVWPMAHCGGILVS